MRNVPTDGYKRVRDIAIKAYSGLPPHDLDDVRYLLDVIRHLSKLATDPAYFAASMYRVPDSRCKTCFGEGCGECNAQTTTV
jgi:hypothetical protein